MHIGNWYYKMCYWKPSPATILIVDKRSDRRKDRSFQRVRTRLLYHDCRVTLYFLKRRCVSPTSRARAPGSVSISINTPIIVGRRINRSQRRPPAGYPISAIAPRTALEQKSSYKVMFKYQTDLDVPANLRSLTSPHHPKCRKNNPLRTHSLPTDTITFHVNTAVRYTF